MKNLITGLITVIALVAFQPAAADALLIGTRSQHFGSDFSYYEHNIGVCYEDIDDSDRRYFGTACFHRNSHKNPAVSAVAGIRFQVAKYLAVGPAVGFTLSEKPNKHYGDPEAFGHNAFQPMVVGAVRIGTEAYAAHLILVPALDSTPAVAWLLFGRGFH